MVIGFAAIFLILIGIFSLVFVNPTGMAFRQVLPAKTTPILPAWDESKCIDSDGGIILDKAGTTRGMFNGKFTVKSDYCLDSSQVMEFYCSRNKNILSLSKNCPASSSCENSRCTPEKYIVAVKEGSNFSKVAEVFATGKKAQLIKYVDLNDLLNKLRLNKPKYLALVAAPEELNPDFMFNLDHTLREIDSDIFLDVAYGVITSFNEADAYEYVNRILAYKTPEDFSIYMPLRKNELLNKFSDTSLKVKVGCINTDVGFASYTCEEVGVEEHTMDKVIQYSQDNQVLWFNVHGQPDKMFFSGNEYLRGNLSGAIGMKDDGEAIYCSCKNEFIGIFKPEEYDAEEEKCFQKGGNNTNGGFGCTSGTFYQEIPFKTNAALLIADSCITIRFNGVPSNKDPIFNSILSTGEDYEIKGEINTSIALSYLKSGALSYIGEGVIASSSFFPENELISESLLHSESIGIALKEYKNKYSLIDSLITDPFTKKYVDIQTSYWVLFGDPALKVSKKKEEVNTCIKKIVPSLKNNTYLYDVTIMFNSTIENNNFMTISSYDTVNNYLSSGSACLVKIPRTVNQNIKINNFLNIFGSDPITNNNFHWNDGEFEWIVFPKLIPPDQDYTFQVEIS